MNGFIKSKKSEKRETSIEPPADLAADLATDLAADLADLTNLADLVNLAYSSNKKDYCISLYYQQEEPVMLWASRAP